MATPSIPKRLFLPFQEKKRTPLRASLAAKYAQSIVLLFMLTIVFSFLYLSEFNNIASQGIIINDLEQQRSQLIIQNEVWNMRIAKLKSLDVITGQDVVKKMQTIDPSEIKFMRIEKK